MEHIKISDSIPEVSRLGIGTWMIGGMARTDTDERDAVQAIRAALDKGINLIDTAPANGYGLAEELVGRAIAEHGARDRIVVSTKAGIEWNNGHVFCNSSPEHLENEFRESLRRLRTDYIDIYQIQCPDPLVPIERTALFMRRLFEQGRIRAIGVNSYSPSEMEVFRQAAPLHICQMPLNIIERDVEQQLLPYCMSEGIRVTAYGVLCRGLLGGLMNEGTSFRPDDIRRVDPKFQKPRFAGYLEAVSRLDRFAREIKGKRIFHLALRWVLDRGPGFALISTRRVEHLDTIEEVWGWKLNAREMEEIDAILKSTIRSADGF